MAIIEKWKKTQWKLYKNTIKECRVIWVLLDLNTNYNGTMLQDGYFGIVKSLSDCQTKCSSTENCQFFSYDCVGMNCYLKSEKGINLNDPNYISAPKSCV